jgi:hypothetical protein
MLDVDIIVKIVSFVAFPKVKQPHLVLPTSPSACIGRLFVSLPRGKKAKGLGMKVL